ncbi:MAG: type II secretion system F family protein [bacterium]
MRITEWLIPLLYLVSFTGLAYVVFHAVRAGMQTYAGEHTTATSQQFEDIFLFIQPDRLRMIAWALAGALFSVFFFIAADLTSLRGLALGATVGTLAGGSALFTPRLTVKFLRQHRLRAFNRQLEDALLTMSSALKSGFSILQAFEAVAKEERNPISQEFTVMLQQTQVGVRFEDALVNLEKRVNSEDLTIMIRSIEIARISGGNLTEVFEKIAETIRERLRIQTRIQTLTAQGKLQGIVVGSMPILLAIAMYAIDPRMMRLFLNSPVGMIVMALVAIMVLIGGLLIRKIIRIDI